MCNQMTVIWPMAFSSANILIKKLKALEVETNSILAIFMLYNRTVTIWKLHVTIFLVIHDLIPIIIRTLILSKRHEDILKSLNLACCKKLVGFIESHLGQFILAETLINEKHNMRVGHHKATAPLQTLLSFSNVCFELLTVDLTGNVTSECCMSFMCVFVFACTSSRVVDSCEIKISIQLIGYSVFGLYLTQIRRYVSYYMFYVLLSGSAQRWARTLKTIEIN